MKFLSEFDLIERYFAKLPSSRSDVLLGSGDDCALLCVPEGQLLAVSMDTLVAGCHFFDTVSPHDLGYKALAVNLSDLAAIGAAPAWVTGALTLPTSCVNDAWLSGFSTGLSELLQQYKIQLVGGDITKGPLSITLQAHGFVPKQSALRRDGAQVGDLVYVTGTVGDAGLALQELQTGRQPDPFLSSRLLRPTARIAAGLALRNLATSAIDISDGLVADLTHILSRSSVGARINIETLPLSTEFLRHFAKDNKGTRSLGTGALRLALTAGDDYELCFTVPPEREARLLTASHAFACTYQRIGVIEAESGLRLVHADGTSFELPKEQETGYRHF